MITILRWVQFVMVQAGNRCELVVTQGAAHGYLMRTRPLYDEAERKTDEFLTSLGLLTP